jgi:hypothetical protein
MTERLIAIGKASKRLIGDKAYDSAELRRGTKPVIPNRIYNERRRIENAFGRLNT